MITLAHIYAAQSNDFEAITAVLAEMDERTTRLGNEAAQRMTGYGDNREDFTQDAREAVLAAIPRYIGASVDGFLGFLYSSAQNALKDKVRAARYQGVDKDAVKVFMSMMELADSDAHKAEALAQTEPAKGLRLSAERARAARVAWQGSVSLDQPNGDNESPSLADTLAVEDETPQVRPKVGTGAALEALAVLQRYSSAYDVLNALPADAEGVDAIEDAVRLPRDPAERRYVLDACAILRSYVSTAQDGDLAADLRDLSDERRDERAAKVNMVRAALDRMSTGQRLVLVHSFGINGAEDFGWGDAGDLEGLADMLGTTTGATKKSRSTARLSFAKHFISLVATTEADALSWADAAASARAQAGRK